MNYTFFNTGITNTVGRILSGVLADLKSVNALMLNNVCMLIAGISIMLAPFAESYPMLVIFSSVFGLTTGIYYTLFFLTQNFKMAGMNCPPWRS